MMEADVVNRKFNVFNSGTDYSFPNFEIGE